MSNNPPTHMNTQSELFPPEPPKASTAEVQELIRLLNDEGWRTAAEIQFTAKLEGYHWSDRKIRAIANASEGQVISGQSGYKLTRQATIEEVQRASAWLRHQSDEMTSRALQIDRVYHREIAPVT
jgi:hypothetical protein